MHVKSGYSLSRLTYRRRPGRSNAFAAPVGRRSGSKEARNWINLPGRKSSRQPLIHTYKHTHSLQQLLNPHHWRHETRHDAMRLRYVAFKYLVHFRADQLRLERQKQMWFIPFMDSSQSCVIAWQRVPYLSVSMMRIPHEEVLYQLSATYLDTRQQQFRPPKSREISLLF